MLEALLETRLGMVISILILLAALKIIDFIVNRYLKKLEKEIDITLHKTVLQKIVRYLYLIIIFFTLYFMTAEILSYFKYTEQIDTVNKIFFILGTFITAYLLSSIFSVIITHSIREERMKNQALFLKRVVNIIIYFIAILIILSYFKIDITPLVATLGVGTLVIGLALQGILSNFFSSLYISSENLIRIGDLIEIPDLKLVGYVIDIGWRVTRIKTLQDTIVIIPNSKLFDSIIVNYSLPYKAINVFVDLGVDYGSNLKRVEEIVLDVAKKIQKELPEADPDFEPKIRYQRFGDNNIEFRVILRAKGYLEHFKVKHEFIKALKERFDKEGIEISWPIRKVFIKEMPK